MATIPLKTITFPGLDNTYTVPQLDDTLTIEGEAADAKATGDKFAELEAIKANIDGSYEQMTVGNAEQLVSSIKEEDKVPYVFRTSGGSIDIGDREEDKIIGGTVAWNQLVQNGNFTNGTNGWFAYGTSLSVSSGVISATSTEGGGYFGFRQADSANLKAKINHKYLLTVEAKSSEDNYKVYTPYFNSEAVTNEKTGTYTYLSSTTWKELSTICKGVAETYIYLGVRKANGSSDGAERTLYGRNAMVFDLTQMFGSTIADYIYSLEQATTGAGVAWFRKLFPNPYYSYDAGTLKHVSGLVSHDMTGFNQWDEEWEVGAISGGVPSFAANAIRSKNFNKCIGGATYFMTCGKTDGGNQNKYYLAMVFYDANKTYIKSTYNNNGTAVAPENAAYFKVITNTSTVVYGDTYNHDICINISWDGSRNGEYEPYVKHTYPLDSTLTLRGIPKLDSNNQLYYDGDEYAADGTVTRRYGIVDLGTLSWNLRTGSGLGDYFYAGLSDIKFAGNFNTVTYPICTSKYVTTPRSYAFADKCICVDGAIATETPSQIQIKDSAYSDATTFKTILSGVYLVYELETPSAETADPFQTPQIVDDFGTEEYVIDNTVTVPIPVGHDTFYQANLVAKLEMAPNSPEGDGDYIVRQTNGENAYVPITFPADELPAAPTTDGNYVLKCTVASGIATFTWEAQS